MAGLLVLMGSGETTPTMVTSHQRILARAGEGARLVLDTPYGFQENADELSERTVEYFAHNVGHAVEVLSLRDASEVGAVASQVAAGRVADAAWVFAGPGSPTYFARQLLATDLPRVLRERLVDTARTTATVLASAAACTAGRLTIPVYELYKVGEAPHWREGLDLLRPLGLDVIVVPHYDNAEGGTHDTSCCYVGDRRLRMLERELDATTWVLGIDEHTAAIIDLEADELRVEGRGRVVVRVRGAEHALPSGTTVPIEELRELAVRLGADRAAPPEPVTDELGRVDDFAAAVARRDLIAAAEATADLLDEAGGLDASLRATVVQQVAALAGIAQAGLHEHRELVAPHVEALLDLRRRAREELRYTDADAIRDALLAAGIEVRDAGEGTGWEFTDPLEGSLADALGDGTTARAG